MKRSWPLSLGVSIALLLGSQAVSAQERRRPPASRPAGDGERTGRAVPRGGGEGSSGGGHSAPAPPPATGGSTATSDGSSGGSSSGGTATSSTGRSGSRRGPRYPATATAGDRGRRGGESGTGGTAVGAYGSRSRGDRPVTGVVVRRDPNDVRDRYLNGVYYSPRAYWGYVPYGFGTFGLGYFYDPFWLGGSSWYTDPYYYGGGAGYGGYGYAGSYGGTYSQAYRDQGSIRLRVKPREAQVYVDGYYVGIVNQFDGIFQSLRLEDGTHRLEFRADGYETQAVDVRIWPDQKITYEAELRRK